MLILSWNILWRQVGFILYIVNLGEKYTMYYIKVANDKFAKVSDSEAARITELPEFYSKSHVIPKELRGTRSRAEIFDESHPEVKEFLKQQDEYTSEAKRKEELRNEAKWAIAKSAGLTEEQLGALFG